MLDEYIKLTLVPRYSIITTACALKELMARIIELKDLPVQDFVGGILETNDNPGSVGSRARISAITIYANGGLMIWTRAVVHFIDGAWKRVPKDPGKHGYLAPGSVMVTDHGRVIWAGNDGNGVAILWPRKPLPGALDVQELPE